jgi:hypothetical protein
MRISWDLVGLKESNKNVGTNSNNLFHPMLVVSTPLYRVHEVGEREREGGRGDERRDAFCL